MANKRKRIIAIIAATTSICLMTGSTFAWQSISQTALNEVSATVNPGGRLHDDFVDITYGDDGAADYETMTYNKDVYVENFTSLASNGVQVFARVRLDEYMEFGTGAGGLGVDGLKASDNQATSLVPGAKLEDKSTWTTHIPGDDTDPFHKYWNWDLEGQTTYMPTFNKNQDSLAAEINGTFKNGFKDHTAYNEGDTLEQYAVYDADNNLDDEVGEVDYKNLSDDIQAGYITAKEEIHTAKATLESTVITMAEYMEKLADADPANDTGNFWVWDTDGWAYWASPINPDTATGLLLDSISRTKEVINEDWYYGINVVAQFITKDDIGQENGTGFYDISGSAPSNNAKILLNEIGVEVKFEVDTLDGLKAALKHGGTIQLNADIEIDTQLEVTNNTIIDLNGKTISNDTAFYSVDDKLWSMISVKGAGTTLTLTDNSDEGTGQIKALENDSFAVDVREGASCVIEGGTYIGNISAVYVHTGSLLVNGGTFSIQQTNTVNANNPYDQLLNCLDVNYENGAAKIVVCGGTFANFNPAESNDGSYVPRGYQSVEDGENVWTVHSVN